VVVDSEGREAVVRKKVERMIRVGSKPAAAKTRPGSHAYRSVRLDKAVTATGSRQRDREGRRGRVDAHVAVGLDTHLFAVIGAEDQRLIVSRTQELGGGIGSAVAEQAPQFRAREDT
jgi:hypothetical protein